MQPASWGFIGTLLGAVVGASASVLTTAINTRNAVRLNKMNNDLERAERARGFQRETLLSMQEVVQDLMRLMARMHIADLRAFRQSGQWRQNRFDDDLNDASMLANRKMTALVERISDDLLRDVLKNLHNEIAAVEQAESAEQAQHAFHAVAPGFEAAMVQLGTKLRTYY